MYNSICLLLLIYNNWKNEVEFSSLSLIEYNFSFSFFFPNEMSKQKLIASGYVFTYHVQKIFLEGYI